MKLPIYKPFHVGDLGVDTDQFLTHLRPIYENLTWDHHDIERGGLSLPTRKRAVAETLLERQGDLWSVTPLLPQPYAQPTSHKEYDRQTPRFYPEPPQGTAIQPEFVKLQQSLADLITSIRAGVKKIRLILTFLRTVVDETRSGICALEGEPHTDGMEYIVSGLVIQRQNLDPDSGVSSVHNLDGARIYKAILQPGEGIFQDDRHLLHHITNIERADPKIPGYRDMLGIDFVINPK